MEKFTVLPEEAPIHLKQFLLKRGLSTAAYRSLKTTKTLYVNDKVTAQDLLLEGNDVVTFAFQDTPSLVVAQLGPLDIIYEDDYFIVLNKPAGVLTHPTTRSAHDTLSNYLSGYFKDKGIIAGIHPISRLDKNTSGLVLFAKKSYVQAFFAKHKPTKEYLGIIEGLPKAKSVVIIAPIGRKEGSIIERKIDPSKGKYAQTQLKVLEEYKDISLVSFILGTGRTHQIRVHAAYIGFPLYNDNLYGHTGPEQRHCLHASKLTLQHPKTGEILSFTASLPQDMKNIIKKHK